MRIHTKLLLLLLVIALLPLLALSLRSQRASEKLAVAIADEGRAIVGGAIESHLQQSIVYASDILSAQQRQVELALRTQAAVIERRLQAPVPADDVAPLYSYKAFEDASTWPPGTELALDHAVVGADRRLTAVPISRTTQAYYLVNGANTPEEIPAEIHANMKRLAGLSTLYRRLSDSVPGLFYWQYVALDDGLLFAFPGHGGYPEGFDPRTRSWYKATVRNGDLTWTRPYLDASTRRLLLTGSMPVRDPDGKIAGVTGIDVDILGRLTALQSRFQLGANTNSFIVRLADAQGDNATAETSGPLSLRVIAASSDEDKGRSWNADAGEAELASDDAVGTQALINDLRAGRGGLRHMRWNGADMVWIYGPIESLKGALIYIVPSGNVAALADQARSSIWKATSEQMHLAAIASVGLMIVVAVISLIAARSVTEPLRELAHVAKGLAAGRLDTRAVVDSRDEVGELADAFNAMVPELQSHIKVKEGLALAHEVQQKLLPAAAPLLPGYDIAGLSVYSEDVGGDYYDFLVMTDATGKRRVGVVVGDVAGHGVVAALTMTAVRVLMRSYAGDGVALLPAMQAINHHLTEDSTGGRFVTLVYMILDPVLGRRQIRWISAGQGPLLLYDIDRKAFEELAVNDIPLGVEDTWHFHEMRRQDWPASGVLLIGTDGIWEAQNEDGKNFGKEGMMETLRETAHLSAQEICDVFGERLRRFRGAKPQRDDITLVVVKFT
jgi:sigma-B regulation protein RsbU (phosphoserine phosphatase)